ncbi:MAG: hypothetical protein RI885_2212 [Actinomycetota bacterium]|jgi:NAD(P)-dependent dehydrogenase (short-subunit alcohol dehydrogenase family)
MTWDTSDLPDLTGTTAIVTGANSGIGLEAARALTAHGAHVVLAVRNAERGSKAARSIGGSNEVRPLDTSDLSSVRAFAEGWSGGIHLLINNAGVMATPLTRTVDGFELQLGTNHLGHFALTGLLLPQVTGRVVTVSSLAHKSGRIDLTDLHFERRRYQRWAAYGQSKLANMLFTLELQHRLGKAGSPVLATAAHPGLSSTNLQKSRNAVEASFARFLMAAIAQDAAAGALPTLYAATADIPGNSFAGPSGRGQIKGSPKLVSRSDTASDIGLAGLLWAESERLTGVTYPV